MEIKQNVQLKDFTTLGLGGPAAYFTHVSNEDELEEALDFAGQKQLPVFVLGGGSNVVAHDEGFPGLVLVNEVKGRAALRDQKTAILEVGAGENWDDTVKYAVEQNWQGIECLSGIPGKAGAAPIQNIGAYGQEVASAIQTVRAFDTRTKKWLEFDSGQCEFGYRKSVFNDSQRGRYIITRVTLRLEVNGSPTLIYPDIKDRFPDPKKARLFDIRSFVIETRAKKGMVILPGYERYQSAGSFFKHPVVSREDFKYVLEKMRQKGAGESHRHWYWPLPSGEIKLVAAHLIEHAGFERGHRKGNVGISPKHALALVHHGGGTSRELIDLAKEVQENVKDAFGVTLHPEPEFVGFKRHPLLEA